MGWMLRSTNSKLWMCAWEAAELVSLGYWDHSPQASIEVSSPTMVVRYRAGFPKCGSQLFYECQDQLTKTLVLQQWFTTWFTWAPMITWQRTSTQTSALAGPLTQSWPSGAAWTQMSLWPWVTDSSGHSDQHSSTSSMAVGQQHGPRWWYRPWTSFQPWTVTDATIGCGRTIDPHDPQPQLIPFVFYY